jgi:hypothetical protein
MPLTIAQKSSVRRHLGYPVAGLVQTSVAGATFASGAVGYRFTQAYGFLEWKLVNLNPDEECRLTGNALAAVLLSGPQPNPGDTISVTLSGGNIAAPQTLMATAVTPVPGQDMRLNLVNSLAGGAAINPILQAAGVIGLAPYGTGPYSQNAVPVVEAAFTSPVPFSITAGGSGVLFPQITATGVQLPPTASLDGINTLWGYLPILDGLESAYAGASQNLDTIQADVWKGRSNELGQRTSLYEVWRGKLSDFLGTPINPQKMNHASSKGALRYS